MYVRYVRLHDCAARAHFSLSLSLQVSYYRICATRTFILVSLFTFSVGGWAQQYKKK